MSKAVSIKDIAKHAGCAVSTVSNVLNGRRQFYSNSTEQKVMYACKRLGYSRNDSGRRLRTGKTETIGVVFTRVAANIFSSVFYLEMIAAIQKRLAELNHDLLLIEHEKDAPRVMRVVSQGKVDGILLLGSMPADLTVVLKEAKTKTVILDSHCDGIESITSDGYTANLEMMKTLSRLKHQHVAYFAYAYEDFNSDDRIAGFYEGAKLFKMKSCRLSRKYLTKEEVCADFEKMMKGKNPPTGILALNDELAYALLGHADKMGLRAPQDFCLFGYDDTQFAVMGDISTAHVDISIMASRAVDMLIRRLNQPETPLQSIRMVAPLRYRKSCPDFALPAPAEVPVSCSMPAQLH